MLLSSTRKTLYHTKCIKWPLPFLLLNVCRFHPRRHNLTKPLQNNTMKAILTCNTMHHRHMTFPLNLTSLSQVPRYTQVSLGRTKNPGRANQPATCIGIYIQVPDDAMERKIMIQASSASTPPVIADALALKLATRIAQGLQLFMATFLVDNLALAKMPEECILYVILSVFAL